MTAKIHTNIHCSEDEKKEYEKAFLELKIKNPKLKQKDIFLAFVKKFSADKEATAKFINLKLNK